MVQYINAKGRALDFEQNKSDSSQIDVKKYGKSMRKKTPSVARISRQNPAVFQR